MYSLIRLLTLYKLDSENVMPVLTAQLLSVVVVNFLQTLSGVRQKAARAKYTLHL